MDLRSIGVHSSRSSFIQIHQQQQQKAEEKLKRLFIDLIDRFQF